MSEQKRTFVRGSSRKVQFSDGSPIIGISINIKDFLSQTRNVSIEEMADEDGWVKIDIQEKRGGKDKYGNTHNVWLNEWRPSGEKRENTPDDDPGDPNQLPF